MTMKKLLLLLLLIPAITFSQSKLKSAKNNLSSSSRTSSSSSSTSTSRTSSGGGGYGAGFFGDLFIELFAFVGYHTFIGQFEYRHFTPYPYFYTNVNGEYDYGIEDTDKKSQLRLGTNYLVGNIINSIELNARYRISPLWGFEMHHQSFFENVRNGTEYLDVTTLGVNYYRLRERFITGWFGAGVTYAGNDVNQFGPMLNIGTEIYPFKPISIHASFQHSNFQNGDINTFRSQVKYHVKKKAFYLGYHDISIAGVKASGMVLGFEYLF
jgi:hypothetical protein